MKREEGYENHFFECFYSFSSKISLWICNSLFTRVLFDSQTEPAISN